MNRLYIISSGVGGVGYIIPSALEALKECDAVVSYSKYIEELDGLLENKELYTSGMTQEIARCNQAIELALLGKRTAIISNGDANVYGMATLIVELIDKKDLWDKIELISFPGITAFLGLASKVGAPISQDFATISLSDRLTDISLINRRIKAALDSDFIIGIYNPKSSKRVEPYRNFLEALDRVGERIVVVAQNIGRESERITITDSRELALKGVEYKEINMNSLLIICNSTSRLTKNNLVLTPRGYLCKYDTDGELLR